MHVKDLTEIGSVVKKLLYFPACMEFVCLFWKVYLRSQILECPSIGEYWNISSVPVLLENVMCLFFRTCYKKAKNTGTQKWV